MANGTWRIARRGGTQVPLVIAAILSVVLNVGGKTHLLPIERIRTGITDRTAPFLRTLNKPVAAVARWGGGIGHLLDVYSENQRLRQESAQLLQWRNVALALQDRLKHYQLLLKAAPDLSYTTVTARVIARSSQPFLETIVLDVGRHQGVRPGQAVVDARGLLGRIYAVGERTSWVILLNDLSSRVPVAIRPGNVQAILAGTSASAPNLEALPQNHGLKDGAQVVTSGDGGLLPAGLPVGVAVLRGSEAKVSLYADPLAVDDVRIVDFASPQEQMPKPSDGELPRPTTLAPSSPQALDEVAAPRRAISVVTGPTSRLTQSHPPGPSNAVSVRRTPTSPTISSEAHPRQPVATEPPPQDADDQ
ncbi:MAG: hypothetical protein JOY77_13195 [Alphaproteobacteria bacterium]|nr:hypothetical protein [Alphaproteobacteria bacterium]